MMYMSVLDSCIAIVAGSTLYNYMRQNVGSSLTSQTISLESSLCLTRLPMLFPLLILALFGTICPTLTTTTQWHFPPCRFLVTLLV
jgi:hypothetical protein